MCRLGNIRYEAKRFAPNVILYCKPLNMGSKHEKGVVKKVGRIVPPKSFVPFSVSSHCKQAVAKCKC